MKKRWTILMLVVSGIMAMVPLWGVAQEAPPLVRVLVVDETKTFTSTMLVAGLIGGLRSAGMFDVNVALGDVSTNYDDPLAGRLPADGEGPYDLMVILPRGLDDGSIDQIWIVSAGLHELMPPVAAGVNAVAGMVDLVFAGIGEAIDVSEDLWPGLLWAVYATKGWIR